MKRGKKKKKEKNSQIVSLHTRRNADLVRKRTPLEHLFQNNTL